GRALSRRLTRASGRRCRAAFRPASRRRRSPSNLHERAYRHVPDHRRARWRIMHALPRDCAGQCAGQAQRESFRRSARSSSIRGNVEAERCMTVLLSGTVIVDGNVEIEHCATKSGYVGPGVQIGRNFECRHNSGPCVAYSGTVRGHVKIDHNASAVATDISLNTIRGSLECHSNVPAPTHPFGANKVTGKADGECAASLGFTVSVGSFPPTAAKAAGGRWVRARSLLAQESFRGPL